MEVAGSSRSQESTVLTRSAPPSVDSSVSADCALARLGALPGAAPALALPGPPCHMTGSPGMGDIVPARGLMGHLPSLASRALAPQAVHGLVDACALVRSLRAPPLPAYGLGGPGRSLRTAPGSVRFACALGVTARGLDERARALLAASGPAVIVRDRVVPGTSPVTVCRIWNQSLLSSDWSRSRERSW